MSHPDPYGSTDPRGWDRPDQPVALPWPEREVEPGPWTRQPGVGPEPHAEPQTRLRPPADPYAERGAPAGPDPYADRYAPDAYDDGRRRPAGPYPPRSEPVRGERRRPGPYPERGRPGPHGDPGHRDDRRPADRPLDDRRPPVDRHPADRHLDERYDRPDEGFDRYPDERYDRHPDERYDRYADDPRVGRFDGHPGPEVDRHAPPAPSTDRYGPPAPGTDRYDGPPGPGADRYGPPGPGADRNAGPGPDRYDGPPGPGPDRSDRPGPDRYAGPTGPAGRFDGEDAYPTAQLEPVRADTAPDGILTDEAEPPAGRRQPGRRRATADRPATQQTASRAGRNLPAAIGVGLGLGALILVPLFLFRPAFLVVIIAAVCVGIWEMTRAVARSGAHPPLVPLVAGGALTVGLAWFAGPDALSLGLLVTVLGTMIWRLGDGPGGFQRDLTAATLIAVYVPFLGGFAALLAAAPDDGAWRILATLVAVVLSDTGGYAAGVMFGKHPMAPSVSPKKSWEGFGGSVTAAALGSALLIWLMFDVAPWWGAVFGLAVSGAAVLGDLAESMIKRDLGVKDMSNLLPGHGGLMDRLDSILFAVPTAYLLLAVIVPLAG